MLLRWLNKLAMESTEPQHGFVNSISFWNLFVFRYNGSDSLWNSALPHDILVEILSGDKSAAFFIIRLFAVFLFFDPVIVYLIKRVTQCVCLYICVSPLQWSLWTQSHLYLSPFISSCLYFGYSSSHVHHGYLQNVLYMLTSLFSESFYSAPYVRFCVGAWKCI